MSDKIKALLVDDELPACETLSWLIKEYCPDFSVTGFAHSADAARRFIQKDHPDVIFLDISMPEENGFDFISSLNGDSILIIFVTAHNEYAVKAFRESAVDYLLKPVDRDELIAATNKIKIRIEEKRMPEYDEALKNLISNFSLNKSNRISVPHSEGIHFIPVQDIVYLEADSNYTIFHLLNGSKIVASKTLAEFEPQLTDSFFRIHKSFNINLNHVNEYVKKDGNSVLMNDGALLPVARRKNEELIQVLLTH